MDHDRNPASPTPDQFSSESESGSNQIIVDRRAVSRRTVDRIGFPRVVVDTQISDTTKEFCMSAHFVPRITDRRERIFE